jgi:hypothetical protein
MEDILKEKAQATSTGEAAPRKTFRERYGFTIMAVIGIVAAGLVSFAVQSGALAHWFSGSSDSTAGPKQVKVVYIDTGAILAHVLKEEANGMLSQGQAAQVGHIVGSTIQEVADGYAAKGDLVLSRNVLAAPESNNLTGMVEKEVDARLRGAVND